MTNGQPTSNDGRRSVRPVGLYLLGFAAAVVLTILLPAPYSSLAFLILVAGSISVGVIALWRARPRPVRPVRPPPVPKPKKPSRFAALSRYHVHSNPLAALFMLIALGLMIAAAIDFNPDNQLMLLADGVNKMLLGGLALGVAIWLSDRLPVLRRPVDLPLGRLRRFWWVFALIGVVMLAAVAEINGEVFHLPLLTDVSELVQYGLMMFGVLLVGYGFGGAPSLWPKWRAIKIDWSLVLPLAAIIGLALFLRLWDQSGTLRYLIDELHWSDGILAVEGRPTLHILTPMSGESPYSWIFPFWQSGAVAILGHNWDGFRFVSAIVGTLTVLAAFGIADEIFDRKTALLAALVLATFPPHVHFSRVAMNLIADPLFGTMALMFLLRALRNNRPIEWAMGGVSLGMTQYFFEGGRLLFPPLLIGFVILLALRGQMRGKGRGLLILLITAVLVGAPFYYTLIGTHSPLFGRYDTSGLDASYLQRFIGDGWSLQGLNTFLQHLFSGFMIFGPHADMSVYYGSPDALILNYLLPFFLIGCFYLAWRYPAPAFLIPLWIVATGLGNGLLRDTLVSARYYVVLPALAIAIAAGLRYLLPFFWLDPPSTRRELRLRWAIPVVAVGVIAVAQINYYFGPYLAYFNVQVRDAKGYRDGIDAASRMNDLPGNTQGYLIGMPVHDQNVPRDWLGFLSQDGDANRYFPLLSVSTGTISPKYLINLPSGVNYAFFIDPTEANAIELIYRYFPGALPPQYSPANIPAHKEYILIYVSSSAERLHVPPKR